jgi:hypothetical protein
MRLRSSSFYMNNELPRPCVPFRNRQHGKTSSSPSYLDTEANALHVVLNSIAMIIYSQCNCTSHLPFRPLIVVKSIRCNLLRKFLQLAIHLPFYQFPGNEFIFNLIPILLHRNHRNLLSIFHVRS